MTRDEHLMWCKNRARDYLARGDVVNAITSMLSDLSKHPDTETVGKSMGPMGLVCMMDKENIEGARRFIDGFR